MEDHTQREAAIVIIISLIKKYQYFKAAIITVSKLDLIKFMIVVDIKVQKILKMLLQREIQKVLKSANQAELILNLKKRMKMGVIKLFQQRL